MNICLIPARKGSKRISNKNIKYFFGKPIISYAIKSAIDYFNIHISDIIIVYDDIVLPIGTMRLREKGQAAGHRGVEDIIYHFSTKNKQIF